MSTNEIMHGSAFKSTRCPICQGILTGTCIESPTDRDAKFLTCEACGEFYLSGTAEAILRGQESDGNRLPDLKRAVMAHKLALADRKKNKPLIDSYWVEQTLDRGELPTPSRQAASLIREVGEAYKKTGRETELTPSLAAKVGTLSKDQLLDLAAQLKQRGLVEDKGTLSSDDKGNPYYIPQISLSLDGWDHFESQLAGLATGHYGFLAMKFGDEQLEMFVREVLKPCVQDELGFELVDMRDVAQAGVIDNIMRAQLQDAAFVVVDLTHDNPGAYWEAGYAEGLGKPVIYLCEKNKFEMAKTHFDTNHCTTVRWDSDANSDFQDEFVATVRRSLNLYPVAKQKT